MTPSLIEGLAVITSLASVVGAARSRVWSWPVGLVAVAAYAIVFGQARLYADLGLQGVYAIQGVIGWWAWRRVGGNAQEVPVRATAAAEWLGTVIGVPIAALLLGQLLSTQTDASLPWADSILTSLSLAANILLMRRATGNWLCWIIADLGYVFLFLKKDLLLSAGLYAVFLIMAIWGWWRWLHHLQTEAGLSTPTDPGTV